MISYKEKQYLVFDFENGKSVKYDLAKNCMIGKRGNPVKSLCSQLSGYCIRDIIDSFQDDKYKLFLYFVWQKSNNFFGYSNVGTFLKQIETFSQFEQFFAAGITNVDVKLRYKITDIPKDLIHLSQEYGFILTNKVVEQYKLHKDIIRNIFEMQFTTISEDDIYNNLLNGTGWMAIPDKFNELILTYKYNYKSLMLYIDSLMTYEAIDNFYDIIRELLDYAHMMSILSPKFEKYPKNFLTTHRIACRNFNRLRQDFPEELYWNIKNKNKSMECEIGEYVIIYPEDIQSIREEASRQHNCLTSYIQKVLDGECHILFMRKKDTPEKSLITLEVIGLHVVQAKGKFNRDLNQLEDRIIRQYNDGLSKAK